MITTSKFTNRKSITFSILLFLGLCFISNTTFAQKIDVKGVVKTKVDGELEELMGVNIYLKDKSAITTTNRKGEFTFPKAINVGDILVFSYLGFITKEIKISKNSTFISVLLKEDDNEMLGALNSKKRFTSKRKSQ